MSKIIFCFCFFIALCVNALAQDKVEVIKMDALESLIHDTSEGIKVINFWATWCAPCIKELPHFEKVGKDYAKKGVEVILISLDFAEKKEKVEQFINRKSLTSKVLLLDEIDYNSWINKVDQRWSGAIPATLVVKGNSKHRKFVEKELQEGELRQLIDELVDQQ